MTDRKSSPFSDEELTEFANGSRSASNPFAAVQDLATVLIAALARITELERGDDAEWAESRRWAAWFAAERDELARQRNFEWSCIADKQREYRNRIAAEEQRAGEMARQATAAQEKVDRVQAVLTAAETETPDTWGLTYVYTYRLREAIEGTLNA